MPIHQTKLVMSNAQPTGMLLPQAPMPSTRVTVIGAVIFLLLQEGLSRVTEYPDLILGPILLLVAIYVHGGIGGLLEGRRRG